MGSLQGKELEKALEVYVTHLWQREGLNKLMPLKGAGKTKPPVNFTMILLAIRAGMCLCTNRRENAILNEKLNKALFEVRRG